MPRKAVVSTVTAPSKPAKAINTAATFKHTITHLRMTRPSAKRVQHRVEKERAVRARCSSWARACRG